MLDAAFAEHQEALLDREMAPARDALARWRAALEAHIAEEEAEILPLYEARAAQPPGGGVGMFRDEHRKLRDLSADLAKRVEALGDAPTKRDVLRLLDQETMVKSFVDHHDRRERAFLYPGLDAVTTPEERSALLAKLGLASTRDVPT